MRQDMTVVIVSDLVACLKIDIEWVCVWYKL